MSLSRSLALFLLTAAVASGQQTPTPSGRAIPGRFLIVYRSGFIPGDAEVRAQSTGAQLVARHDRLGIAVVQGQPSRDALQLRQLASQPGVAYVVHDRVVTADKLILAPVSLPVQKPRTSTPPTQLSGPTLTPPPPGAISSLLAHSQPSDTYYSSSQGWAIRQVGGYGKSIAGGLKHGPWDITLGTGVRIAVLDSGVDTAHPDIAPNLALNITEVDQTALPSPCDDGSPQDQQGHGTWTASLAAGSLGPNTGLTAGVAPQATLLNIKVLERVPSGGTGDLSSQCANGQASGLLSWVIQGIEDAVANRADIISLSLGTLVDLNTGEGAGLKAAFDQVTYSAQQAGSVIVASAGNDGFDLSNTRFIELPAQARGVLAVVASTNPDCAENILTGAACTPGSITMPYYSNHGAPLNALAAPGGSYPQASATAVSGWIRGACSSGKPVTADGLPTDQNHSFGCFNLGHEQYVQAMGTSASAPLAAGVAALLRAANPTWDAATIVARMRGSAVKISTLAVPQISAAAALGFSAN